MSLGWGTNPIPLGTPWKPLDGINIAGAVLRFG